MTARGILGQLAASIRTSAGGPKSAPAALFSPSSEFEVTASVDAEHVERLAEQLAMAALTRLEDALPTEAPSEDIADLANAAASILQSAAYVILVETLRDSSINSNRITANAVAVRFVEIFHQGVANALALTRLKVGSKSGAN